MALLNVGDVVASVAALLDDPSQTDIDQDYVIPFLNLRWANLIVNLAALGLQYSEESAVFDIAANVLTLNTFMLSGQPLGSLMQPVSIDWKEVGDPDSSYTPIARVNRLDDRPQGCEGIDQFAWVGGSVQLQPSNMALTLRVRFNALSTTLVDPTDGMIRGVTDILAYKTAELIYAIRGNPLKVDMKTLGTEAMEDFCAMSVINSQSALIQLQPTHPRGSRFGANFTMPPGYDN